MGSLVKCPKCSWRGFRYYFPNHYDKVHPMDIYTEATRVDEEMLDSRPRIQVPNQTLTAAAATNTPTVALSRQRN